MPPTLLPDPDRLAVECVSWDGQVIRLAVRVTTSTACCPLCGQSATRVHSRYARTLGDLPWLGLPVRLRLTIRRFVCAAPACPRRIFAERVPGVAAPYARRTRRLTQTLTLLALALGGEAGARVSVGFEVAVSADTLLRLIRQAPLPAVPTPRVLGVDDWSKRKGKRSGTILVDLERHRVIDLLDGREAEPLRAWLVAHPGVEIITRDRAGPYADAARRGAPAARQVADRFHLITNLHAALRHLLDRHHQAVSAVTGSQQPGHAVPSLAREEARSAQRQARRAERYQRVQEAWTAGTSMRTIAREFHMGRNAISQYLTTGHIPTWEGAAAARSPLTPYLDPLRQHWEAGEHRPEVLWRLLQEAGYAGSRSPIIRQVSRWRVHPPGKERAPPVRLLTMPQAAWVLLLPDATLDATEQEALTRLLAHEPQLGTARRLALEFRELLTARDLGRYQRWLQAARNCGVRELVSFAHGLERDAAAVEAAITTAWSNGQTEGQVHRLKVIKRQMFGRANLDLLRRRVLAAC